jgi:molybdopterin synthase catalytic subunit
MTLQPDPTEGDAVALVGVREEALSVDEVLAAVRHPACGAVALFVGVVRDHDHGRGVERLDYSAHPSAADELARVCEVVAARTDAVRIAAVHRTGPLAIGDLAVVAAAAAPHRDQAFVACRDLIDTLKAEVPVWKHQVFADGVSEWVGLP